MRTSSKSDTEVHGHHKASVGRMVHFVEGDGEHRAAIVSKVKSGEMVNLHVAVPSGWAMRYAVKFDAGCGNGTWHWPEREPVVGRPEVVE